MSLDTSRWRSSTTYDYVDTLTAPDVGWEWLRRNEHYQDSYTAFSRAEPSAITPADGAARKWGLRFPGPSRV